MQDHKKVLIVGVGLIGGSFALALKEHSHIEFGGFDLDRNNLEEAKRLGLIQETFASYHMAVKWADLVLLTIPVQAIKAILPETLDLLEAHQVLVDFGSTKSSICSVADSHPKRKQFIAGHPIAGTEHSGPAAAFDTLFKDQNLILCDTEKTDRDLLMQFEQLATAAGFYLTKMDAEEHDRHLAYISHLSHVSSYVLSNTVLKKEEDGEVILDLAGSGFESTVRLAKSSPEMWSSIFLENKAMILNGIAAYKEELSRLEDLIRQDQAAGISAYLQEGRRIRKILK